MAFRLLAALTGITLVGIVVVGVLDAGLQPQESTAMVEVAPGGVIDRKDAPQSVAVLYRAAHQQAEIYQGVPCSCGCEAMLGHRHLLDCFARPGGRVGSPCHRLWGLPR